MLVLTSWRCETPGAFPAVEQLAAWREADPCSSDADYSDSIKWGRAGLRSGNGKQSEK